MITGRPFLAGNFHQLLYLMYSNESSLQRYAKSDFVETPSCRENESSHIFKRRCIIDFTLSYPRLEESVTTSYKRVLFSFGSWAAAIAEIR